MVRVQTAEVKAFTLDGVGRRKVSRDSKTVCDRGRSGRQSRRHRPQLIQTD